MTVTHEQRVGMTMDEFLEESNRQPFEIINGERKPKLPNASLHSFIIRLLYRLLDGFVLKNNLGEAFIETTFVLPDAYGPNWVTGARIPDLMFYAGSRVADYQAAHPEWQLYPFALVPDFVIEVVSPTDRFSDVDEKVDAYLADGVRLIWVIDPQRKKAIAHAPDFEQPIHYTGSATLSADDVLPGFQLALDELFKG